MIPKQFFDTKLLNMLEQDNNNWYLWKF